MATTRSAQLVTVGVIGVALVYSAAGCESSSDGATADPPVSAPDSESAPATTTAPPSTIAVTTPAPTTTAATTLPPADLVGEWNAAIELAQKAFKDCYAMAPTPCDRQQLEDALVGPAFALLSADVDTDAAEGNTNERVDEMTWTVIEEPSPIGEDLAVARLCEFDPILWRGPDGEVLSDNVTYVLQEWNLLPVGDGWKVSEVIDVEKFPEQEGTCASS